MARIKEDRVLRRFNNPMDALSAGLLSFSLVGGYAAWLTSIVFCSAHGLRPLLFASAVLFPVGVVHGIGVWFGGW